MARKRKELDNIERDVIAAMALGYGVHYGNYKANHPHTKEMEPEPISSDMGACRYCGRLFRRDRGHRKLYCDDYCRQAYNSQQEYLAKKRKEAMQNV